ncbi:hypothetical protein CFI11_13180 [Thalassococcus sp. S3]|nr:hypothetical protein CFI11_13180 [Thalassococcus sp. S3]
MQTQISPASGRGRKKHQGEAEALPSLRNGFCDYCGDPLPKSSRARHARFCSPTCRKNWWIVARNRGAQLYQLLLIWRLHRGRRGTPGQGMINLISAQIDRWISEDRRGAE